MKRLILASTALAMMSASAFAADLPARTMAPAPAPFVAAPMFTWTGFYAGVNAGWTRSDGRVTRGAFAGTGNADLDDNGNGNNFGFPARLGTQNRSGFIGGVQAGYNQQFGMFVAGIEADINWLGNRRYNTATNRTFGGNAVGLTTSSRTDWLGTARLRGGVAFDQFFIYGTGGLAFGAPNHRVNVAVNGAQTHTGSNDDMKAGWTAGGGVEFAFTNNITMKAEYLYYDLGRTTVTATGVNGNIGTASARFDNKGHIARVGLNYKF
jgi:outer membrane immunogenic protein